MKQKKVIFVENHANQMTDNFILLYNLVKQKNYNSSVHYLKISVSTWGEIILRTLVLIWDMSNAKCVFLNESNSVFGAFTLRKDTKLVQLWHACGAFKKWGYSVADKTFGDDKKTLDIYSGHRNYDLVSTSGKAVCWAYEEAFGLQKKMGIVKPLGVSRTDVYFSEDRKRQAYFRLKDLDISKGNRKVILYAPTFRGEIRDAKAPDKLNLEELYRLSKEYIVLIKQHPFIKKPIKIQEEYRDFCMEITDEMSIEDLLMVADICVTDYSSVVFEYALMEKPMIFFAYDLEEYYDERGFYYPYKSFVPGPIVKTTKELVDYIEKIEEFDMERIRVFRQKYMSGCDGHSTERILENVLEETF